jgi:hypothetical protein
MMELPQISGYVLNVTQMLADCDAGLMGAPVVWPMGLFGGASAKAVNREKVDAFKTQPNILALPVITLLGPDGAPQSFPDGNHRLTALRELGKETFTSYVVPFSAIDAYGIPLSLLIGALGFLRDTHEAASETLRDRPTQDNAVSFLVTTYRASSAVLQAEGLAPSN